MSNKRIAFHNLGCKVNSYETSVMIQQMESEGYKIVPFDEIADVYVVNTCVVTAIADKKSRQMLRRAKTVNPESLVIAVGCYVNKDADYLIDNGICDAVIGNNEKNKLSDIINSKQNSTISDIFDKNTIYEEPEIFAAFHERSRAFIKIQDGCDMDCAYCIIPSVRGKSRSREIDAIISEANNLAKSGYKEIVLTGVHLSSFISSNKKRLIDAINEISNIGGIERIRIGSVEPTVISDLFIENIKNVEKFCPHFHLSLQSGCDRILGLMNRHYHTSHIYNAVKRIRNIYPDAGISADIIVGFPGESEDDHKLTLKLLEDIKLTDVHAFPYSKRKGTKAYDMPLQLEKRIKDKRLKDIYNTVNKSREEYCKRMIGKTVKVLFETENTGLSKEYLKVKSDKEYNVGDIITDTVKGCGKDGILYI